MGIASSLRTQGYLNMRLGDYPLGLSQLTRALAILEALDCPGGTPDALPDVYDGLAGIYAQIGSYPEALDYMHKQLAAAERIGDMRRVANAYNNLANIYMRAGPARTGARNPAAQSAARDRRSATHASSASPTSTWPRSTS